MFTILYTELKQSLRNPLQSIAMVILVLLSSILLHIALRDSVVLGKYITTLLWIFTFTSMIFSLNTAFVTEKNIGIFDVWVQSAHKIYYFVFAKIISQWVLFSIGFLALMPVFMILESLSLHDAFLLYGVGILSALSCISIQNFCNSTTLHKTRTFNISYIIAIPLNIPVFILTISALQSIFTNINIVPVIISVAILGFFWCSISIFVTAHCIRYYCYQ